MLTTHPFDDDHLKEECGVVGIFGVEEAATHCVLGLHALQHRGQEAAGIVAYDGSASTPTAPRAMSPTISRINPWSAS